MKTYTVTILGEIFEVEAETIQKAKTAGSHKYRELHGNDYPIAFLQAIARVRVADKDNKKLKFCPETFLGDKNKKEARR